MERATLHTGALERAEALAREAKDLFPTGIPAMTAEVTPVIGSHVGPGALGFVAIRAAP